MGIRLKLVGVEAASDYLTMTMSKQKGGRFGGSVTLLRPDGAQYPGSPFTGSGLPGRRLRPGDGNENVWISNFNTPSSPIVQLCGVRTENCPPGMKTGDQISPPSGYVGGGLQMQTDLAIDPAGNVWGMNNWQDIGTPDEALSTRCGDQGVPVFYGMVKTGPRTTDRARSRTVSDRLPKRPHLAFAGPANLSVSVFKQGGVNGLADLYISPIQLNWVIGSQHFTFAPGVTTPTGGYNVDRSLNIGRSYWSFDLSGSYTYFDPKQSTDISVTPGFLFNTQNPATHYSAGNEFHLDWLVGQFLSEQFAVGAAGYFYKQISGDGGRVVGTIDVSGFSAAGIHRSLEPPKKLG